MRKRIFVIWSILLIIGFTIWSIAYFRTNSKEKNDGIFFLTEAFNYSSATTLLRDLQNSCTDTCLLTIGYGDCDLCKTLIESDYYKGLPYSKSYIDMTLSDTNRLLSQALYTKSFPTTYIIGPNFEILGNVEGTYSFKYKSEDILFKHQPYSDIEIHGVKQDSVLPMMSFSLRALASLWNNQMEEMKTYAELSLKKGSYFFNNYLLYSFYRDKNRQDSASIYRRTALRYNQHVNVYIYENLIDSLQNNQP